MSEADRIVQRLAGRARVHFQEEYARLLRALRMDSGGSFYFVDVEHTAVLRDIAFGLATELALADREVREQALPSAEVELALPLQGQGVVFLYLLAEDPSGLRPTYADPEALLKELNWRRDVMARTGRSWVLWVPRRAGQALRWQAPDLWSVKSGVFDLLLPPGIGVEPARYSVELGPAEAGERLAAALRLARQLRPGSGAEANQRRLLADLLRSLGDQEGAQDQLARAQALLAAQGRLALLEDTYRAQLAARFEWLETRWLRRGRAYVRVRLEDVYVPLRIMAASEPAAEWPAGDQKTMPPGAALPGMESDDVGRRALTLTLSQKGEGIGPAPTGGAARAAAEPRRPLGRARLRQEHPRASPGLPPGGRPAGGVESAGPAGAVLAPSGGPGGIRRLWRAGRRQKASGKRRSEPRP